MKKLWVIGYLIIVIAALAAAATTVIATDPFFHFHAPNTDAYFYPLNNQRSQNDGISRNFEYEGLITGTSMTENFMASEAEELFGGKFIKVPYAGGTYNEINQNLTVAASHNQKLKYIIRGLDMYMFSDDTDRWRTELGNYPTYLYDENLLNDVEYVFNRDVLFARAYPMTKENDGPDFTGGITSFDIYSNWMRYYPFGHKRVLSDGLPLKTPAESAVLTQEETDNITANIQQNVTALAEQYPDITFYYFLTPYSAAWWCSLLAEGNLDKQIESERVVIEEILKHDNIKLFSFNCLFPITTDLNHYTYVIHYGEWINSLILHYMHDGKCLLTRDNYLSYLEEERQFYKNYDYTQLATQEDYEDDYYAAALLSAACRGTEPYSVSLDDDAAIELSGAVIKRNQYHGQKGIVCTGSLNRPPESEATLSEYLRDRKYIGARIQLPDVSQYEYLVFFGKKETDHGQATVRIYDKSGKETAAFDEGYQVLDNEWHQYVVDIRNANGPCTLILHGGYIDNTGSADSRFIFSNITLY